MNPCLVRNKIKIDLVEIKCWGFLTLYLVCITSFKVILITTLQGIGQEYEE